jgi:uncharacterized protein YceH (UPF0502 family)
MNGSRFFDLLLTIAGIALVTTLILPGRQTAKVTRAGGAAFSDVLRASMGR